jgi:hypothetical protein
MTLKQVSPLNFRYFTGGWWKEAGYQELHFKSITYISPMDPYEELFTMLFF